MKTRVQFLDVAEGISRLRSDEDCFVPEMSLPIKDILQQFAYIDNIRLADIAKQGYEHANNDDSDFDVEDFDRLDPAEKEELFNRASEVISKYEEFQRKQQQRKQQQPPDVDEEVIP